MKWGRSSGISTRSADTPAIHVEIISSGAQQALLGPAALADHITTLNANEDALSAFPAGLFALSSLTHLNLGNNNISGPIPSGLGDLSRLEHLGLANNLLSGGIPPELGNLSQLDYLELDNNALSGAIPVELANLGNVTFFQLSGNPLSGSLSPELGNLSSVVYFYISDTQISGSIPATLSNLTGVTNVHLSGNQLSAVEPGTFSGMTRLQELRLQDNGFDQAVVDEVIAQIWGARAAYTASAPTLEVGGTNAAPSGQYVDPDTSPGQENNDSNWEWDSEGGCHRPLSALAKVYDLQHDGCGDGFNRWVVTWTGGP